MELAMGWRLRRIGVLGVSCLALLGLAGAGNSTETLWDELYRTAWAGIYTSDQAARGESAYRSLCARCHGVSLEGSYEAPALKGRDFAGDWNWANIADLYEKIQYTMPANRPRALNDSQIAEILSYILKANRFPAGSSALPASADDLRGVLFVGELSRE